jgi:hypothetical protein
MRLATACLLAAAVHAAGPLQPPAVAKPPELPLNQKITCQPRAGLDEEATSTLLFGVGINSNAGLTGQVLAVEKPASCPRLGEMLGRCWHTLGQCFLGRSAFVSVEVMGEVPLKQSVSVELIPAMPVEIASEPNCPYLRQKIRASKTPPAQAINRSVTVVDNIENLEAAEKIYRQGEDFRSAGQIESACQCYEKVRRLCPGSRYDRQAALRLSQVCARRDAQAREGSAEEQEPVLTTERRAVHSGEVEAIPAPRHEVSANKDSVATETPFARCTLKLGRINVNVQLTDDGEHGSVSFGLATEFSGMGAILLEHGAWIGKELIQKMGVGVDVAGDKD